LLKFKKISNIKRLRQIINILVKHGLGHLVKVTGLHTYITIGKRLLLIKENSEEKARYSNPQRLVMAFEELGPSFIKLGQILSTRKDQIPKEYIAELEKLQDSVAPVPFEELDDVFEAEFGKKSSDAFDFIDKNPMASASVAQVHAARLKTGEEVVVKIRKPGIEQVINADLKILDFIAHHLQKMAFSENKMFDPIGIVKEFRAVIKNELDFSLEGRYLERFQLNFKDNPTVYFPKVYWEHCSSQILVMEKLEGISVGDVKRLRENGHDLKKIASNLFHFCLQQMFIDAFFHADPHPGNIIVMENDVIGIIDCGMVGFMEEYFVNAFIDCFVGLLLKDYDSVARGYVAVGTISEDIDLGAFKIDIRNFAERYMNVSLNTVSIATLIDDGVGVAVRNNMKIPPAMLFTTKALISIEGTIRKIDPAFDFVGHSTKFAETLVARRKLDPKKITSNMINFISELSELAQTFPGKTSKILSMIERQSMGINVTLSGSENFTKKLDSYATRISLALISAGLGVASSIVIQAKIAPLLFGVSLLGLLGYAMAVVLGLWVLFLIYKKGR
jgi:ubiquinone biosynthesis protein